MRRYSKQTGAHCSVLSFRIALRKFRVYVQIATIRTQRALFFYYVRELGARRTPGGTFGFQKPLMYNKDKNLFFLQLTE